MKYTIIALFFLLSSDIFSQGNVGIGNYPPERMLDVGADGTQYARFRSTNGGSVGLELMRNGALDDWRIANSGTWLDIYNSSNDFLSASIKFSFKNNGQLAIGHSNPAYPLDVQGTANINKNISSGPALFVNGAETIWYNGTYFSWGFGGTANYFANPIGIGTATPQATLHVIGDARITSLAGTGSREMRVDPNGRPFSVEEIYTVSPAAFQCSQAWSGGLGGLTHGYTATGEYADGNVADDDCEVLVAGIQMNQGDVIGQIILHVKDATTDRNLKIQLFRKSHISDTSILIGDASSSNTGTQTIVAPFITITTIDNQNYSYFLKAFCYNLGEDVNTPVLWAPGTQLLGVVIN